MFIYIKCVKKIKALLEHEILKKIHVVENDAQYKTKSALFALRHCFLPRISIIHSVYELPTIHFVHLFVQFNYVASAPHKYRGLLKFAPFNPVNSILSPANWKLAHKKKDVPACRMPLAINSVLPPRLIQI